MPKLEPKQVQKELDEGQLWPVYWIHGQERMKARELLKRIRRAALPAGNAGSFNLGEETIEASETNGPAVVDAAQSLTLGGGLRFIVVRDAHELKESDALTALFGPKSPVAELGSVCVFVSKDLDLRKKISKALVDKAAVVACEEIAEADREPWIEYLAKQRKMELDPKLVTRLRSLDPWSLDIIDQELEKLSLSGDSSGDVLLMGGTEGSASDRFIEGLFSRSAPAAYEALQAFAQEPEESIPLLGLLGWNARHLALAVATEGPARAKVNPYLAERLKRWEPRWDRQSVGELQSALCELDFGTKQTPLLPLGLWTDLVIRFCENR